MNKLTPRSLLAVWLLAPLTVAFAADAARPPDAVTQPHILFTLADDLGIDGVSCYSAATRQTPTIDRLALEGTTECQTILSDWPVPPTCSPGRITDRRSVGRTLCATARSSSRPARRWTG